MVRTVKCGGVLEYQTNVGNEFIGIVIARSVFIGIGFKRMGRNNLAIDCSKIHRGLNNGWVVGNIEPHNVDGFYKRVSVSHLLQNTDCGQAESMLGNTQGRHVLRGGRS